MMKRLLCFKRLQNRKSFYASIGLVVLIFAFQNCSNPKVVKSNIQVISDKLAVDNSTDNPVCTIESKPPSFENVACLPPFQFNKRAIQNYFVICQSDGQWGRTPKGAVDFRMCNTCPPSLRPADRENISCPLPYADDKKGIQNYAVYCQSNFEWGRSIAGPADYSSCVSCDSSKRPTETGSIPCMAPLNNVISGIQNYKVTCDSSGQWKLETGVADYKNCPDCNPASKPKDKETVKCQDSGDMKAVQNYSVMCVNHAWVQTPTNYDTVSCPVYSCDPSLKPLPTEAVACSAPFKSVIKAVRTYDVSCMGKDWFMQVRSVDESQCPKNCDGATPAATVEKLNCPAPFENSTLARQNYIYTCNNSTGLFERTTNGVVDYSQCPRACAGTPPPSSVVISCDPGTTGTAYQLFSNTCDTVTGQYVQTKTAVDKSLCVTSVCTGLKPADSSARACPAPFQDRMLAKQQNLVTCDNVNNIWKSVALDAVLDSSSCPVNDCSDSINPGNEQVVGSCTGGATGSVFKTCAVSCSGRSYNQINCSAPNYSKCDCGPNAIYNTSTRQCVPKEASCTPATYSNTAVSCGAGYNGGTKYTMTSVTCPTGPYGASTTGTGDYITEACISCPAAEVYSDTPICSANEDAVVNSRKFTRNYSCSSGKAVASVTMTNVGICNPKAISAPTCSGLDDYLAMYLPNGNTCLARTEIDYCPYPVEHNWPLWNGEVYYNSYELTDWTAWQVQTSTKNGVPYRSEHRERCIIHIFQPGGGA